MRRHEHRSQQQQQREHVGGRGACGERAAVADEYGWRGGVEQVADDEDAALHLERLPYHKRQPHRVQDQAHQPTHKRVPAVRAAQHDGERRGEPEEHAHEGASASEEGHGGVLRHVRVNHHVRCAQRRHAAVRRELQRVHARAALREVQTVEHGATVVARPRLRGPHGAVDHARRRRRPHGPAAVDEVTRRRVRRPAQRRFQAHKLVVRCARACGCVAVARLCGLLEVIGACEADAADERQRRQPHQLVRQRRRHARARRRRRRSRTHEAQAERVVALAHVGGRERVADAQHLGRQVAERDGGDGRGDVEHDVVRQRDAGHQLEGRVAVQLECDHAIRVRRVDVHGEVDAALRVADGQGGHASQRRAAGSKRAVQHGR
mmetsp:Transcript_24231/g.84137  ORF Transcript_24231/g.84137 Transcript_24231/m.84137 type:complete len:378 (-) Transcript_24231:1190-2323(-)